MLSTLTRRVIYTGDGANADFAYTYKVHSDDHLKVFVDGVDSSISVHGRNADQESSPGGTLTTTGAPALGSKVVVMRVIPETQTTDYTPYGSFPASSHENRLDEIVMSVQEHSDELARALVAPIDDDGTTDYTLPAPDANKLLAWNATGDGLVNAASVSEVAANAAAAAASEAAAAASEAAALISETNAASSETAAATSETNAADSAAAAAASAAFRGVLVYLDSDQIIQNDLTTRLNFDQESYDTDDIHDNITNNERLTVPAGVSKVRLIARIDVAPAPLTGGFVAIEKNNSSSYVGYTKASIIDNSFWLQLTSPVISVSPGDYFHIEIYQASGGLAYIRGIAAGNETWFAMEIIE